MELAVIRIRGSIKVNKVIVDTLKMLNLNKTNHCIVIQNKPNYLGMIKKCKDYITWGELNSETKKELTKRKDAKRPNLFRLAPPKGGFERKGIKKPFTLGGVLGYRGDKINTLIKKML
ncbi:uL30 family ribosomal protein [Candidatus Woesearchaeota archaeon]|nr:uL30 family ribosomal protein [Candidatus Woesearchaeota archaeon]MBL7050589.1 uL30 family ribosomal protein [Candidatus Woesearchaeota archaeon]